MIPLSCHIVFHALFSQSFICLLSFTAVDSTIPMNATIDLANMTDAWNKTTEKKQSIVVGEISLQVEYCLIYFCFVGLFIYIYILYTYVYMTGCIDRESQ